MRYIVGDIHGCFDKLQTLLNTVNFNKKTDILYSVGDFCDRGGQCEEVLHQIIGNIIFNEDWFRPVFGNHDIWLYQFLDDKLNLRIMGRDPWETWEYNGGKKTHTILDNFTEEEKRVLFEWLGNLPYRIELDDFIIQHTTLKYDNLLGSVSPTELTLKQCLDENICEKDYDSWFWDRSIIYTSKEMFGNNAIPKTDGYNLTKKTLIVGHTPMINGPYFDKELNLINIDTGSFIVKERYNTEKDGEICILNLDSMEWNKSDGTKGLFK